MTDIANDDDEANELFRTGMKYDLRQSQLPEDAMLARASFQNAARMGHTGAMRALASMMFYGAGGVRDKEGSLLLLWELPTT